MSDSVKQVSCVMLVDAWFPLYQDGPGEFSGLQFHVLQLRQQLIRKKTQVELFFPSNPNPLIRWSWSVIVIAQVLLFARRHRPDIIHSHGLISAFPAKILSLLLHIPHVHTLHRATHLSLGQRSPQALLEWVVFTRLRYARLISLAQSFASRQSVPSPVSVIPNGIDIKTFDKITIKKDPNPSIIWVGRDDPSKGLEYLKKAIKRVRLKYPQLETRLITGGQLTGADLFKAYKRSHIFVLPSLHETQPLSLLEAWAARLPVIVTDVGDNRHMVEHGVNGLLIEPANVKQLTDAILKLIRSRVTHKRLGDAGYQYVKSHYSWQEVAAKTLSVYKTSINQAKVLHATQSQARQNSPMSRLSRQHQIRAIQKS